MSTGTAKFYNGQIGNWPVGMAGKQVRHVLQDSGNLLHPCNPADQGRLPQYRIRNECEPHEGLATEYTLKEIQSPLQGGIVEVGDQDGQRSTAQQS